MSSWKKKLVFGVLIAAMGLLLVLVPQTRFLEQKIGLPILFQLRGQKTPPPDVLIITLDKDSAEHLNLAPEPDSWPRSLHAELVQRLTEEGVKSIAFDLHFKKPQSPENDGLLAAAIQQAGNVVLCECLTTERLQSGTFTAQIERPAPPVKELERSAAALAPFPLPKVPVKVAQYWTFKSSAGGKPTLPVMAFQIFSWDSYDDLRALIKTVAPVQVHTLSPSKNILSSGHLSAGVRNLRELFMQEPSLPRKLLKELQQSRSLADNQQGLKNLKSLISMYQSPENPFLNYYGPPGTIKTVPYYQVLGKDISGLKNQKSLDLQDKAVFVGLSANLRPEQQDGFYTVFSQSTGVDISGVEIAATAFANILEDSHVRPLPSILMLGIVTVWGLLIALICWPSHPFRCALGGAALCAFYIIGVQQLFALRALWFPLVIPVCLQFPLAIFWAILWSFREMYKEKQSISTALGRYLPPEVADKLAHEQKESASSSRLVYGTCLITDAGHYTTLSEQLSPEELNAFMKRYYETLFKPIKEHKGTVINIVGDSMLALWTSSTPDMSIKKKACLAALKIPASIGGLHPTFPHINLTTRIGLHFGEIYVGDIGALDHYEYRPCGDIVNTASRLEGLNKFLGTRILVSYDVLDQLDGFVFRELGQFLLAGKSKPLAVFELICPSEAANGRTREVCEIFQAGLMAFKRHSFSEAQDLFSQALQTFPGDGPSQFYCRLCTKYDQDKVDSEWNGVICLETK